jgi:D-amino peptidase
VDVLISVDLEGVAGIATRQQIHPQGRDYPAARALMTAEANAALAGRAFPGVVTVPVKTALGRTAARSRHPAAARAAIAAGAARAVSGAAAGAIRPLAIPPELVIEAELRPNGAAEMAAWVPGTERAGSRTLRYRAASPRAAMDVLNVWSALTSYYLSR